MIIAEQVRLRIKDVVEGVKFIGGAAAVAALKDTAISYPAVFVLTLSETGGANNLACMAVEQNRTQRLGIIIAVKNVKDASGNAAINDLQKLRLQIDDALTGWSPQLVDAITNLYNYYFKPVVWVDPVMFASGRLLSLADGVVWWQDEYVTNYLRRAS